ncbi:MAG TPA: methylated-DNA--[protein]-cysteine S-methyltransferase [Solirubrobacteraceae bacterium]|nr:methylated-DNA--[protein]-cysteine S-methyltransferase [Solirubrobacteraceae bacterium]
MRVETPIGEMVATWDGRGALTGLWFGARYAGGGGGDRGPATGDDAALRRQLGEYFAGERRAFDLPLAPAGTPWQRAVWAALLEVPYGETVTYAELAARAGRPGAARAAGAANGRNPISVVVPCHRVIGTSGSLTGYGGGLDAKGWLLALERGGRSPAPSPGSPPPRTTGRRAHPAA